MKEYIVELRVTVEDEVLEEYEDVTNLVLETTQEVPFSFDIEVCREAVNQVESKYGGGWIPCSEQLPKESDYYMACIYNSEVDDFDFRKTWFAHVDDYDMEESEWRELYDFESVTAWQPLPEPYKVKEE